MPVATESARSKIAPLPPAEHAGGEKKRERRSGGLAITGPAGPSGAGRPGDRCHVRFLVEAGGSPSSEALLCARA